MAWRSSGTTNGEMVDNLKRFGVIHSLHVENGFRAVDRRFFVPRNQQHMAHTDQPLKEGNIHISAPHIYGSVVEALELTGNSSLSFLNIGSGTGYLSCIAAEILGPTSMHYGIEVHQDVVEHCHESIEAWRASRPTSEALAHIEIFCGNGLHIDASQGEPAVGFDRIYIGAALDRRHLGQIASLLKPGGVLVGPVGDELVKVVRISNNGQAADSTPPRSFRGQPPLLSGDFSQQVISGVRFAPLVSNHTTPVVIPSRVWSPSVHSLYPESFRAAAKEILLCSRASSIQPPPIQPTRSLNVAATLPRALWLEILSYTRRDWFEKPQSEEDFLRRRLREEQAAAQRAHEAQVEAESRLHMAERERDIYRLLALRWQRRLQAHYQRNNSDGSNNGREGEDVFAADLDDVAAAAAFAGDEPLIIRLGGLRAMVRSFQNDSDDDDEEEEAGNDDQDTEDDDEDVEDESMADDDGEIMQEGSESRDADPMSVSQDAEPMSVSPPSESSAMMVRPRELRTVSITSEDL